MHKAPIYSTTTGLVFRLAPVVYLASTLVALLLVPVGDFRAVISFNGDVVLFCYLLALGRVMLILAAMETGSSIDGMGASREALRCTARAGTLLGSGHPGAGFGNPLVFTGVCRCQRWNNRNGGGHGIVDVRPVQSPVG